MNNHISSDALISHHRVRADYTPSPFDTLQFSYGYNRYTKFTFQLHRQPNNLKKKILNQLQQDFVQCQAINLALSSDLFSVLLSLLPNPDDEIRLMTVTIIKQICQSPFGRSTIINRDCIKNYQALINDTVIAIRLQTYLGLMNFITFQQGIHCIMKDDTILSHLVDKLLQQKEGIILIQTVRVLNKLMEGPTATQKALKTPIITRLIDLITHGDAEIVTEVCKTLCSMSFDELGKKAIVGEIKKIYFCIKHQHASVRDAGCLLLCSLAQLNQGKIEIIKLGEYAVFQALLNDRAEIALNIVQLIASLAEDPAGRKMFTPIMPVLQSITHVQRIYLEETLNVIKWTP